MLWSQRPHSIGKCATAECQSYSPGLDPVSVTRRPSAGNPDQQDWNPSSNTSIQEQTWNVEVLQARPDLGAHTVLSATELAEMALYGLAAVGFLRRSGRFHHQFFGWLAISAPTRPIVDRSERPAAIVARRVSGRR